MGQKTIIQAKMRKESVNVEKILNGLKRLTPRKHEVLNQVVLGRPNKEIASESPARSGAPLRYNCPHPEAAFGTARESSAGRSQFDFMTVSLEQLDADIFFQQANLCAERWLG
jgi:hypothetical protein